MDSPCPRAALEVRICDLIAGGKTLASLEQLPGFPSRRTVWRWSRENPVFAAGLKTARDWRRGQLSWARTGPSFDAARAEALLDEVRRGATVAALVRRPDFPNRRKLNRWKQERPEFAHGLAAALAAPGRPPADRRRSYDEASADRIVARVAAGVRLPQVLREPGLPSALLLARWRKDRPDFDHAVRTALLWGRRRRAAARRVATPELAARICRRIRTGATLESLAGKRGMPHRATLHRWLRRDRAFAEKVRAARLAHDEPLADEVLEIAEQATPETLDEARRRIAEIKRRMGPRRGERSARSAPRRDRAVGEGQRQGIGREADPLDVS